MIDAFWISIRGASELSGVSVTTLRKWHREGILTPNLTWERGRGLGRLYSFQDMIALRLLARVRGRVAPDELRKIQTWVQARQPTSIQPNPVRWEELEVVVTDRMLSFNDNGHHPNHAGATDRGLADYERLGEIVDRLRLDIDQIKQRKQEDIGQITRRRGVLGSAWILAGTRIPTAAIWDFHNAGYDTAGIVSQYPILQPADVEAAIAHEQELRKLNAA